MLACGADACLTAAEVFPNRRALFVVRRSVASATLSRPPGGSHDRLEPKPRNDTKPKTNPTISVRLLRPVYTTTVTGCVCLLPSFLPSLLSSFFPPSLPAAHGRVNLTAESTSTSHGGAIVGTAGARVPPAFVSKQTSPCRTKPTLHRSSPHPHPRPRNHSTLRSSMPGVALMSSIRTRCIRGDLARRRIQHTGRLTARYRGW